jgi:lysyl-tRNA synthetase class 2
VARWVARLVALTGFVDIVAAVLPPNHSRLRLLVDTFTLAGVQTARAATAAVGLLLIYLGRGLRRRSRDAWYLAAGLAAASCVLNIVKGLDIDAAALSGFVLALLVATRGEFQAIAGWASRWRALAALLGFGVAGFALGVAEIATRSARLAPGQPPRLWAEHVLYGMVGVSGPLRFTSPAVDQAVTITTGTMGLLSAAVALVLLLRPGAPRPGLSAEDMTRIRSVLDRYGEQDSLGYFALRRDKSVIWSPSGKAGVAYRVISGVSLASGDPIGDPEAWPGAITEWLRESRRHGWTPAVLGCGEKAGHVYARHGLDAIELGDEAIVDVGQFTLDGRAMRGVRQAVARLDRAGYTCEVVRQRDLTPAVLAEVVHASDRLRDGDVERGFSMALSRVGDATDSECVLALARDHDGRLRGLLQFVPWGRTGLSLDLMRRDRNGDNGIIEFMVVAVLRQARSLGVSRVSLNFAVLRSVFARGDRLGAGPVLRGWRRLLLIASRFWQIESLYRANAKYQPAWLPRYLCFPSMGDLPRIGIAALRAEAFIVPPRPLARIAGLFSRRPAAIEPDPAGCPDASTMDICSDQPTADAVLPDAVRPDAVHPDAVRPDAVRPDKVTAWS